MHLRRRKSASRDVPDLLDHNSYDSAPECQKTSDSDGDCCRKMPSSHVTFSYVYKRNKSHDWVPVVPDASADDLEQEVTANKAETFRSQGRTTVTSKQYQEDEIDENEGPNVSVFVSPDRPCCKSVKAGVRNSKHSSSVFIRSCKTGASKTQCKPAYTEADSLNHSCASLSSVESTSSQASSGDFVLVESNVPGSGPVFATNAPWSTAGERSSLDDSLNQLVETNSDTSYHAVDLKIQACVKTRKAGARGQAASLNKKRGQMVDAAVGSAVATVHDVSVGSSEVNVSTNLSKSKQHDESVASTAGKRHVSASSAAAKRHDVSVGSCEVKLHDMSSGTDAAIPCDAFTEMNDTLITTANERYSINLG